MSREYINRVGAAAILGAALQITTASAQEPPAPVPGVQGPASGYTVRLTLEDAVRRAVENNPELAIVRLETQVEAARVDETQTAFAPVLSSAERVPCLLCASRRPVAAFGFSPVW